MKVGHFHKFISLVNKFERVSYGLKWFSQTIFIFVVFSKNKKNLFRLFFFFLTTVLKELLLKNTCLKNKKQETRGVFVFCF